MPDRFLTDTYNELDRTLWSIEREKCLEALSLGKSARPYLERRLLRIDRMLRALETILGPRP